MKTEEIVDIELEDLEVTEGVEVIADPIEAEIAAAAAPAKGKKAKKEKVAKEPKAPKEKGEGLASTRALAEDEVGASYIADILGIDSRELRMFLRKNYRNMEAEKSQRYVWKKGDPKVQEIIDAFKAHKAAPRATKVKDPTPAE